MSDQNATEAAKEIRNLIRSGKKTSEIINMRKWPNDFIKAIKSQELESDKAAAREREKKDQQTHMAGKRERHHQAFLKRMGIESVPADLENVKAPETVVGAPALDAAVDTGAGTEGFKPSEG